MGEVCAEVMRSLGQQSSSTIRILKYNRTVVTRPRFRKINVRNRIAASIELPLCFCNHHVWRQFIDDFNLRLLLCVEDGKIYFLIAPNSVERFCPFLWGCLNIRSN